MSGEFDPGGGVASEANSLIAKAGGELPAMALEAPSTDPAMVAMMEAQGTFWEGLIPWSDPRMRATCSGVRRGPTPPVPARRPGAARALRRNAGGASRGRDARRIVKGAEWDVDDLPVPWDETAATSSARNIWSTTGGRRPGRPASPESRCWED